MSSKTNTPSQTIVLRPGSVSLTFSSRLTQVRYHGFRKRMEKHTVVPIQEEDLHWKFEVPLSKAVSLNAYERHRESSTTH